MRFEFRNVKVLLLSVLLALCLAAGLLGVVHVNIVTASELAVTPTENGFAVSGDASALGARQAISTAYVVVRFGTHDAIVRPVTFTEPISAYRALERSGLSFTTDDQGFGLLLCSIEEVGDSSAACDNGTQYWGTSFWNGNQERWDMRMVGIAGAMISEDGHVEGFSWSDPNWTAVDPPPAPAMTAAWEALGWLADQQQTDGSYGAAGNTAEVLMALGANRMSGANWRQGDGPSLLSAMLHQGEALANMASGAGKLALALSPQASCWPCGAMWPMDYYSMTTGAFDTGAAPHALAMLGMAALSETVPAAATEYLLNLQLPSGGWEWGMDWGADTNSTAFALQALIAGGISPTSTSVISGLDYLKQAQNPDGGFPYDPDSSYGTDSDTNSTAYVLQSLLAVGEDPLSTKWSVGEDSETMTWVISGINPVAFLLRMQLPDGSFEWQRDGGANQMATQQATIALLYQPFPIRSASLSMCPCKVFLPLVIRD